MTRRIAACLIALPLLAATSAHAVDIEVETEVERPKVIVIQQATPQGQAKPSVARPIVVQREVVSAPKPVKTATLKLITQKARYIGVVTGPLSAEMSAQLKLPAGVGLLVVQTLPDSPAAKAGIKKHDVLHKLGDQLLVNHEQLRTLMQQHKKGDSARLTVITGGESKEVGVKVDERDMPVAQANPAIIRHTLRPSMPHPDRLLNRVREELMRQGKLPRANQNESVASYQDNEHKITLKVVNDKKFLKVHDKTGKVVFDGEISTEKQFNAVPDDIKTKVKKLNLAKKASVRVMPVGPRDPFGQDLETTRKHLDELRKRLRMQIDGLDLKVAPNPQGDIDVEALRQRIQKQVEEAMRQHGLNQQRLRLNLQAGPGGAHQAVSTAVYSDGTHTLEVKNENGHKTLKAKDKAGKVLFEGPVNTDAERAKVPAELRQKLERLERQARVNIQINPNNPFRPQPKQRDGERQAF